MQNRCIFGAIFGDNIKYEVSKNYFCAKLGRLPCAGITGTPTAPQCLEMPHCYSSPRVLGHPSCGASDFSQRLQCNCHNSFRELGFQNPHPRKKSLLLACLSASTEPRVRRGRVRRAASSRVGPERQSAVAFVPVSGAVSARRVCGVLPPYASRAGRGSADGLDAKAPFGATLRTAVSLVWSRFMWVFPQDASPCS